MRSTPPRAAKPPKAGRARPPTRSPPPSAREASFDDITAEADHSAGEEEMPVPEPVPMMPAHGRAAYVEAAPDAQSNILGMLLFLPMLALLYTAIVAVAGLRGVTPGDPLLDSELDLVHPRRRHRRLADRDGRLLHGRPREVRRGGRVRKERRSKPRSRRRKRRQKKNPPRPRNPKNRPKRKRASSARRSSPQGVPMQSSVGAGLKPAPVFYPASPAQNLFSYSPRRSRRTRRRSGKHGGEIVGAPGLRFLLGPAGSDCLY